MGCLATGCSWTNSIPLNELTIMCLNRERTRDREEGLVLMVKEQRGERRSTKEQRQKNELNKIIDNLHPEDR